MRCCASTLSSIVSAYEVAAWSVIDPQDLPMNPRLLGRPGVGKTTLAHVIAHEIVHDYHSDAVGIRVYRRLPWWKRGPATPVTRNKTWRYCFRSRPFAKTSLTIHSMTRRW